MTFVPLSRLKEWNKIYTLLVLRCRSSSFPSKTQNHNFAKLKIIKSFTSSSFSGDFLLVANVNCKWDWWNYDRLCLAGVLWQAPNNTQNANSNLATACRNLLTFRVNWSLGKWSDKRMIDVERGIRIMSVMRSPCGSELDVRLIFGGFEGCLNIYRDKFVVL